jgi:hypothetical protein
MIGSRIVFGAAVTSASVLHGAAASAQETGSARELQIYGREICADRLTETPLCGSTPRLTDAPALGVRYNFNFKQSFGTQLEVVDFNGCYGYFSRRVTDFGQGLNTAETSLGRGWRL